MAFVEGLRRALMELPCIEQARCQCVQSLLNGERIGLTGAGTGFGQPTTILIDGVFETFGDSMMARLCSTSLSASFVFAVSRSVD